MNIQVKTENFSFFFLNRYLAHRVSILSVTSLDFQTILWQNLLLKILVGGHAMSLLCEKPVRCPLSHFLLSMAHREHSVYHCGIFHTSTTNLPSSRRPAESLQILKYQVYGWFTNSDDKICHLKIYSHFAN